MVIKLDVKDKKILAELDKNSRQPLSRIAKKVRLSKEAVYYRIKNLEKKNIITGYATTVSLAKLGLTHIKSLIKFQNTNKEKKQEIINYFVSDKNTNWVASCYGSYDLIVGFVVRSLQEFEHIKDDYLNKYNQYIALNDISIMLEGYLYGRKYFGGREQEIKEYVGKPGDLKPDKQTIRILELLSTNTRIKTTELASRLRTTARIIAYKIKQLEKQGIIQKYTISINHALLGINFFKSFIYLKNTEKKNELFSYLSMQKNCLHNVDVLSKWNLEPEFEVFSNQEYYSIIEDLKDKFSESIKTSDTILISKEHKFELFPRTVF